MKYFLDTANLAEIEDALQKGAIRGVTTNPSLLAKEPKADFFEHIKKIASLCSTYGNVPLSAEVFAQEPSGMLRQAFEMKEKIGYSNLNIKIPIGYEELQVVHDLTEAGIEVNCTCCFSATQLQLAAHAGARYVSLFYNRLLDIQGNPAKVLQRTRQVIDINNLNCEIIAGSIRNAYDIEDAWASGAHIVTAGHKVLVAATKHPKTDESVEGFLKDFSHWIE
tara:strand:+ start:1592 stop:2257 length:666 start_codon:yes stop_codon:yes gene_type:complete